MLVELGQGHIGTKREAEAITLLNFCRQPVATGPLLYLSLNAMKINAFDSLNFAVNIF